MGKRLPPGCGLDCDKSLLANPYQLGFQAARRLRYCLACKTVGSMTSLGGGYTCPSCHAVHATNLTAPRVYQHLHLRAGRRSGKSLAGAHAVREEITIPKSRWWVCGPTFKILHDATMPTFLRLIPPSWVADWNQDNLEVGFINQSVVQFRSLDDPERGRGQGLHGAWLDEAAFISKRAWDVLAPSLAENAGISISTTSPASFDWSYYEFYKRALLDREPGFWAAKYRTIDNPLFSTNPVLVKEVENARRTKSPEVFAAEYEGEDINFTGAIYNAGLIDSQVLRTDEAIRVYLPEWPRIDPSRMRIVGLDSGADHPFGAMLIVAVPEGLIVLDEYLERNRAISVHADAIRPQFFPPHRAVAASSTVRWAANKNEKALRLEWGLKHIGILPAESDHTTGIQRVQSWLQTRQLFFAYTVPRTIEQMRAYRYADNYGLDGQKKTKEDVFKQNDELPDCLRYGVMAWPELPKADQPSRTPEEQRRWAALDDKSKADLAFMKTYHERDKQRDLEPMDDNYPLGNFNSTVEPMFGW